MIILSSITASTTPSYSFFTLSSVYGLTLLLSFYGLALCYLCDKPSIVRMGFLSVSFRTNISKCVYFNIRGIFRSRVRSGVIKAEICVVGFTVSCAYKLSDVCVLALAPVSIHR